MEDFTLMLIGLFVALILLHLIGRIIGWALGIRIAHNRTTFIVTYTATPINHNRSGNTIGYKITVPQLTENKP